jgi:MarR family transcriptional regulator, multiple gene regulator MgrA
MSKSIQELLRTQRNFSSIQHKALMGLMLVSGQQTDKQQHFFKQYGISTQQYNVLRILRGQYPNPCNLLTIRERLIDKMSDVSRLIERLRKAELVERIVNSQDRRHVDVLISTKGLDLLQQLDYEIAPLWQLNDLSEAEAEILVGFLERILE